MRPIDADALKIPSTSVDMFENCRNCRLLDEEQVREIIDNAPTIDAVEVVHGEWIDNCEDCRNWNHNYGACTEIECKYEPNNFDKDINVRSNDEPKLSEIPTSKCHYEPKDEPTTEDCSTVDKDINVRSKDETQYDAEEVAKDINRRVEMVKKEWSARHIEDEPTTQTETQNSNLTFKTLEYCNICDHKGCEECISNALDEHCIPSQFKKQIEDECIECHYEPKDEPKMDIGIGCSRCGVRFGCIDRDMPHAVHCNSYGKITDEPQTDCP